MKKKKLFGGWIEHRTECYSIFKKAKYIVALLYFTLHCLLKNPTNILGLTTEQIFVKKPAVSKLYVNLQKFRLS